jgi:hypothetical protein
MVVVAQCTDLRAEEVLALEWEDIDFESLSMKVIRAVVHGRVKTVKTDYSEDELPLDPGFAEVLLIWKRRLGPNAKHKTGFQPHSWGWTWSSQAPPLAGISMRLQPSRTIFVPLAAALWHVLSAEVGQASGAYRMARRRTGSVCRFTTSGGMLPASTAAWGGIPSAIPIAPGWIALRHRLACSKN